MLNLEKTINLGQKFASLNTLLYHKLLPEIAGVFQVHQFLTSLFIDNVKSDHQYVVWQTNDPNNTRLRCLEKLEKKLINRTCINERLSLYTPGRLHMILYSTIYKWVFHDFSWVFTFWEMFSGFCPARFGVLFCSVVLGYRYTIN